MKIIETMKNFIKKISDFLKRILGNSSDIMRVNAKVAVFVTEKIKTAIESNKATLVVNLIPGNLDNVLLALLRKVLPTVLVHMNVLFGSIQEHDENADALNSIIEKMNSIHPSLRGSFYLSFSAELAKALSDSKLSLAEIALLVQMIYLEIKKR